MTTQSPASLTWKLGILSRDYQQYAALLTPLLPDNVTLCSSTNDPSQFDTHGIQLALGDPDLLAQIVEQCHELRWIQSTFAGNAPLLRAAKRDYQLTGVKGIFDQQMREYVFSYLLYFARNLEAFNLARHKTTNKWHPPAFDELAGKTLGIAGAGDIAAGLVDVATLFGMQVIGLNRSGTATADYAKIYRPEEKLTFASQCDYLLSLLPDTLATRHFIDDALLQALPAHCVLINAGRGITIDDEALINALSTKQISAAVLDVFVDEPLPDEHPYWALPNAYITQHTAAISREADVAVIFKGNLIRFLEAQPLIYAFDFDKGY
ncbi:D-2-hydroxyacid dehydrogenase [Alteromonas lipolytica]|uniref:D-isomer specific 2-hydroxyacid dehydrogenase NAD-binding domain-containing protein n=1 Tax=Alteromonas lipolytica TaxID=1856405 RepID=A0A1E8FA04_9ALTE|nr:D-2-hydroxyacid dehydrogenase [Alteromonas lipolytica]OFI32741.1 hypothetical protein BFC17_06210 [Alteromonas lipolytica]GGF73492.1 2-hydroxyacid dehydrogenase [Alteromonas lipolytica]